MAIAGHLGLVQASTDDISFSTVAGVRSYSWAEDTDVAETTSFDDSGGKSRLPTMKSFPIEFSGDFSVDGAGMDIVREALKTQDKIYIKIYPDRSGSAGIDVGAYVQTLKISGSVTSTIEFSATLASDGLPA